MSTLAKLVIMSTACAPQSHVRALVTHGVWTLARRLGYTSAAGLVAEHALRLLWGWFADHGRHWRDFPFEIASNAAGRGAERVAPEDCVRCRYFYFAYFLF
jgi:hypothetical protein